MSSNDKWEYGEYLYDEEHRFGGIVDEAEYEYRRKKQLVSSTLVKETAYLS
jgi:hypothetical protein